MDNQDKPKLNKATLSRVSSLAKSYYLQRGNCDGSLYLDPNEITARAYMEATLAVLEAEGYVLTKKSLSNK